MLEYVISNKNIAFDTLAKKLESDIYMFMHAAEYGVYHHNQMEMLYNTITYKDSVK